ncbi:MAG: hypothetical protein DMF71_11930 [Acidobacteria bacterium]|nr:MAG: hypothetical protein DMF71_11930 [Acidobacteriota bacterium]
MLGKSPRKRTIDNSPAIYRWERGKQMISSPLQRAAEGITEPLAVASGLIAQFQPRASINLVHARWLKLSL